jgi:hypothetical protein
MGEWIPDEKALDIEDCESWCDALLWIVPANVEGMWKMPQGELNLSQEFQMVSGNLKTGKNIISISEGRLYGDLISFIANNEKYSGRVNGNSIDGTVTTGKKSNKWNATRTGN